MSKLKLFLKTSVIIYVFICIAMYGLQRNLMYRPATNIDSPASYGLVDFSTIRLKTSDGISIEAWYHPAKENYPTIIYFHGNAGNLSDRANFFSLFRDVGFGVLGVDYRGYGKSEGDPSEKGFYQDARATMDYAAKTLSLSDNKIIIYGESIGTAVAVQMATEYKVAALVLQSPFTSMEATASRQYYFLPVNLLLKDRFDSLSKIENIKTPLLLFHGEMDTLVPLAFGKELFAKASEPKQAIYYPEIGHHGFDLEKLVRAINEFSKTHKLFD
jgi:uncharacterized protein